MSPTTKAQNYTTTVSDFASKVGGNIADFVGLIKDVKDIFFTFKKAWGIWRKKSSSKGDKVRASFEAGKTSLNMVKDGVATVRNLLFTLTNAWQAVLSTAVPILGIAINALKLCMNVYEVIKAGKHRTLMTRIMNNGQDSDLAKYLWKINVKRIKRQVINITNAFLKIGADIATLTGVGAILGVVLKSGASATELVAKGLRTIKQGGRNLATKKGAWKITKKVFNVEKSTSKKRENYKDFAEKLYELIQNNNNDKSPKNGNLPDFIRAAGLSWKSLSSQMKADPYKGREMLIKSLKRRE